LGREGKLRARSLNALEVDVAQLSPSAVTTDHLEFQAPVSVLIKRSFIRLLSPNSWRNVIAELKLGATSYRPGVLPNPSIGRKRANLLPALYHRCVFDPSDLPMASSLVSHGAK